MYQLENPETAPQKGICFNHYYEQLKQTKREKLLSDEGQRIYA